MILPGMKGFRKTSLMTFTNRFNILADFRIFKLRQAVVQLWKKNSTNFANQVLFF